MTALATAFRLFFLLAGLMAAVWIPAWVVIFSRDSQLSSNLSPLGWHAHEMVFGYAGAVLAGFLLTATRNWTKRETLSGAGLAGLAVLWVLGRVAALHSLRLPLALPPVIDGLFFAIVAAAIARPIGLARSWRNASFPVLVLVIGACDVLVHLHVLGHVGMWSTRALDVALDCILLILFIFAGRIIPLFTKNATKRPVRERGLFDRIALATVVAYVVGHALWPGSSIAYVAAIVAGVLNGSRLLGWGGSRTLKTPLLWVLHAGWLLLSAGLALRGANGLVPMVAPSTWTHLITVGGLGLTTLGMMSRVALGHTGRPLVAPQAAAFAFVLVLVATASRVAASALAPGQDSGLLWVATASWAVAFAAFSLRYAPILLSRRADGKPG